MKKLIGVVLVSTMLLIRFPFTAFSLPNDTITYLINIRTMNDVDASANGDVYLKLYGDKGETAFWKVTYDISDKAAQKTDRLQTDDTLSCVIRERDVGKITKIKLAYYPSAKDDNTWEIDWLELDGARYPVEKTISAETGYPCVLNIEFVHPENGRPTLGRYLVMDGRQYDKLPHISYNKSYSLKIKTDSKTSASILSVPILLVIIGGAIVILTTAVVAVFIVKKRK
ncbi:MAG: PLAT/LH2 domain-containing protein [Oscillospiraceae bacterium]